jgi:hypothetical protein
VQIGEVAPEEPEVIVAKELDFSNGENRTSQTTAQQVWEQNGVKLTNNKAKSTSNVADYVNPARFYKSSQIIIECAGMTKIEFTCGSNTYATALKSSIVLEGVTVTVSGMVVTVEFEAPVDSYTIESLTGGQVRVNSLTVYAKA